MKACGASTEDRKAQLDAMRGQGPRVVAVFRVMMGSDRLEAEIFAPDQPGSSFSDPKADARELRRGVQSMGGPMPPDFDPDKGRFELFEVGSTKELSVDLPVTVPGRGDAVQRIPGRIYALAGAEHGHAVFFASPSPRGDELFAISHRIMHHVRAAAPPATPFEWGQRIGAVVVYGPAAGVAIVAVGATPWQRQKQRRTAAKARAGKKRRKRRPVDDPSDTPGSRV